MTITTETFEAFCYVYWHRPVINTPFLTTTAYFLCSCSVKIGLGPVFLVL